MQLGLWILGVGLFLSAIAAPKFLRPLEGVLRHIGRSLMRLLGAIALAALFFFLMTPIGWARRLFGDPLNRAWDTTVPSYWKPVPSDTAPQRYQRMY